MAKKAAVESCLNFSNKLELNANTRSLRAPWKWTPQNVNRREDVLSIFNGLKKYWPLTERQAFLPAAFLPGG